MPAALNKFGQRFAIGHLSGCRVRLNALATKLSNAIKAICVQGKDGQPCFAPSESYPYLRYVRHAKDDWLAPVTEDAELDALVKSVKEVRAYLADKFKKPL